MLYERAGKVAGDALCREFIDALPARGRPFFVVGDLTVPRVGAHLVTPHPTTPEYPGGSRIGARIFLQGMCAPMTWLGRKRGRFQSLNNNSPSTPSSALG